MMSSLEKTVFRRRFITLALKRVRPGTGSGLEFLKQRSWIYPVANLNLILDKGSFVIVGDVATRLYMPERSTLDLDILVLAQDAEKVYRQLAAAGGRRVGDLSIPSSQWELPDATSLNVLISDETWAMAALANPNHEPEGLPVIALPYLVLMKLTASRAQDLADISRMLGGANQADLGFVKQTIQTYLPDAVEDLESLITLGQLEYEISKGESGELLPAQGNDMSG